VSTFPGKGQIQIEHFLRKCPVADYRSKRNIPLPVFQNEPKGIIIEYTYKTGVISLSWV